MDTPLACTLGPQGAEDRVAEWRLLLTSAAVESRRESDRSLRIRLRPSPDELVRVVDLASRESACCGFFEFSIDIGMDSNWLVVRVTPEAVPVLDDFAGLVPGPSPR